MISPAARVHADLPMLLSRVATAYQLGSVHDWAVLTTGYEDCNLDLQAGQRVVVKVFATGRETIACRTAGIIEHARCSGVCHPRLHRDTDGRLVHHEAGHAVLVMDHVAGSTVYDLARAPTGDELAMLLEQAARLHTAPVPHEPMFVDDPWAITNLVLLARQTTELLDVEQQHLIDRAVAAIEGVDRAALPTALIHADLTQGNVLLSDDGVVTVLDFGVANRFPRVQELAVVAANLTHGDPTPLPERAERIAHLYSTTSPIPLSETEHVAMRAYCRAAAAMEFLAALREWHRGNDSPETSMLVELGLAGLRDYGRVS